MGRNLDRSGARKLAGAAVLAALASLAAAGPAAAEWAFREAAGRPVAGTLVEGQFAGLRLACAAPGDVELALTHNGATFEAGRDYTASVTVDGVATLLTMRGAASGRPGDDDLVARGEPAGLSGLVDSLARGSRLEIAAPTGRYELSLSGSSRAIAALREAC